MQSKAFYYVFSETGLRTECIKLLYQETQFLIKYKDFYIFSSHGSKLYFIEFQNSFLHLLSSWAFRNLLFEVISKSFFPLALNFADIYFNCGILLKVFSLNVQNEAAYVQRAYFSILVCKHVYEQL